MSAPGSSSAAESLGASGVALVACIAAAGCATLLLLLLLYYYYYPLRSCCPLGKSLLSPPTSPAPAPAAVEVSAGLSFSFQGQLPLPDCESGQKAGTPEPALDPVFIRSLPHATCSTKSKTITLFTKASGRRPWHTEASQALLVRLDSVPGVGIRIDQLHSSSSSDTLLCAVCLVHFSDEDAIKWLPGCGHSFHAPCIAAWLRAHASCPECKAPVLPALEEFLDRCQSPVTPRSLHCVQPFFIKGNKEGNLGGDAVTPRQVCVGEDVESRDVTVLKHLHQMRVALEGGNLSTC